MSSQISTRELLNTVRGIYTQRQVAEHVGRNSQTVRRWERGEIEPPEMLRASLRELLEHQTQRQLASFTFADLFAGIGGIRAGFEAQGGRCVFTSEWNKFSVQTYVENYGLHGASGSFTGDITVVRADDVPDHDILLAGFPCQPFSIAGVSKKNSLGRAHGFEDATQGTLFFDVARILDVKRPKAFMLENVKNLVSHDKGNTFRIMMETLQSDLGYQVHTRIIDGQHWTPQHRERIMLVGFREANDFSWDGLDLPTHAPKLGQILHKTDGTEPLLEHDAGRYFDHAAQQVPERFTLTPKLWQYLQDYAAKHRAAGNGFGFGLADAQSVTRTLSARYYKDGSEILVDQGAGQRPRRLTPRECARLMGFPDSFRIPVSDTQAYQQFGNSVVVPVMTEVARLMAPYVSE